MALRLLGVLVLVTLVGATVAHTATLASPTAQGAREVTVLVGAGQDTVDILAFFPQNLRVHTGDTIIWKQFGDASHTVSFFGSFPGPTSANVFVEPGASVPSPNLPFPGRPGVTYLNPVRTLPFPGREVFGSTYSGEGFVSSGRLLGVNQTPGIPEVDTFSLTFDKPGSYPYVCLTHADQMYGAVEVVAATAAVPNQAEIDAQAQVEVAALMSLIDRTMAQRSNSRSEPGPANNTIWYVSAGNHWFQLGDPRSALQEFFPRDVTIRSGDTVVWGSTGFHTVTFNPVPPTPTDNVVESLPDGGQAIVNNPMTRDPVKPAPIYDPTRFFNSGNLSPNQPNGTAWTLTFETPGTFEYYCTPHLELGMKGTVTVVAR